jgi:hypothetical protein
MHQPVGSQIAHYKTAYLLLADHGQYTHTMDTPPPKVEIAKKPVSRPALNTRSKVRSITTPPPLIEIERAHDTCAVSEHQPPMKRKRVAFQSEPLLLEKGDDHQDPNNRNSDDYNHSFEHGESGYDDPVSEQTTSVQNPPRSPDPWVKNHVQHRVMPPPAPDEAFQTVKQFLGAGQAAAVRTSCAHPCRR